MASFPAVRRIAELPADADGRKISEALGELRRRGRATGRDRLRRLRIYLVLAAQAGLAAALAWTVSYEVVAASEPVFAPVTAVATIATSVNRRLRRTIELIVGVTIGVAVGDLLIEIIGTGPWQTGVIVALAIVVAIVLKGSSPMMTQAGGTAVLIASLSPTTQNLEAPRFVNAAIGGAVGLVVVLLLLPLNPLRLVERRASPLLDRLAQQLTATAGALIGRDAGQAERALHRLDGDADLQQLREAVQAAREVATYSPVRRRRQNTLAQYQDGIEHMERAFRDSRAMMRRIVTLLRDGEPVPAALPAAVNRFGEAVRLLHREFLDGREPERARTRALRAASDAGRANAEGLGFHGTAAVAQLRTMVHDLLRATGLDRTDARALVRRTFAT